MNRLTFEELWKELDTLPKAIKKFEEFKDFELYKSFDREKPFGVSKIIMYKENGKSEQYLVIIDAEGITSAYGKSDIHKLYETFLTFENEMLNEDITKRLQEGLEEGEKEVIAKHGLHLTTLFTRTNKTSKINMPKCSDKHNANLIDELIVGLLAIAPKSEERSKIITYLRQLRNEKE